TQLAGALECAHQNGTARLDAKPANIMLLADGSVKIMDFSTARMADPGITGPARLSRMLLNSALYTAPEQFGGPDGADARSDIFSYGVIFYELLTAKHPFEAKDAAGVSFRILQEE